jgi:hypothetical protein
MDHGSRGYLLVFNISLELCLLGLASFLGLLFVLDFLEILFQRGECGTKASEQAICEHRKIRSKRGKFVPGGLWMMVSIQASVSGSNFVNFCKFMLALLVLS